MSYIDQIIEICAPISKLKSKYHMVPCMTLKTIRIQPFRKKFILEMWTRIRHHKKPWTDLKDLKPQAF